MTTHQRKRLEKLKNDIDSIDVLWFENQPEMVHILKIVQRDSLSLLHYSMSRIFPDDFTVRGFDVIHNKTKLEFYEVACDFFGINEFGKYLLFFNQEDIDKSKIQYRIENQNTYKTIKKNISKILEIKK